ncbi:MAG: twin-arginine translocase TatA/TatE family subunit [Acidimicrobiia bacterium]
MEGLFSPSHILIIAAVILIFFGGSAIPKFAHGLGKAQTEFKKGFETGAADAGKPSDFDA